MKQIIFLLFIINSFLLLGQNDSISTEKFYISLSTGFDYDNNSSFQDTSDNLIKDNTVKTFSINSSVSLGVLINDRSILGLSLSHNYRSSNNPSWNWYSRKRRGYGASAFYRVNWLEQNGVGLNLTFSGGWSHNLWQRTGVNQQNESELYTEKTNRYFLDFTPGFYLNIKKNIFLNLTFASISISNSQKITDYITSIPGFSASGSSNEVNLKWNSIGIGFYIMF